jgi:cellulose synthase/poly-beta-1,6-N-acetylglucosamine synthase-like glycosyltransferase
MIDLFLVPVAILYLLVVGSLFVYGLNFLYLTALSLREKELRVDPPVLNNYPRVTVQLPIYNEMYVAERLIEAAASFDYPLEYLEIQVLDDSTDETTTIVDNVVRRIQSQGKNIICLRRIDRQGYKAGALAEGLKVASGEFFAIFDADFIPSPDFLKNSLPYFFTSVQPGERQVAFVQTRWGHVNRNYSLLTYLQSLAIDAHFVVEQFARSRGGYWFNFNGTAGVWRKQAILDAGGWTADTLTEDLDLSYRAFLRGWRGVYLRHVEVCAELPVSFTAFRRQQHRWACGSIECAMKFIPQVWNAPIPFRMKLEATLHLTGYFVHLLLFSLTLLYPLVLILSQRYPALISLFGIALIFNLTAFAPTIFFLSAQHQLGRRWWRQLPLVLFLTASGAGMMLNTVRAAWHAMRGGKKVFERTPKFGISQRGQDWKKRRYQLRLDPLAYWELALGILNLATVGLSVTLGNWLIGLYAAIFALGLFFAAFSTFGQAIAHQLVWTSKRSRLFKPTRKLSPK